MKKSILIFLLLFTYGFLSGCVGSEENRFSAEQQSALSAKVDSLMEAEFPSDGPGAAIAVISQGIIIHKRGYGLADIDRKIPFTTGTSSYLGSVSKQFTAMGIMMLQEQEKLQYDDTIQKYFPDTPEEWGTITVWNLLTHTSGLIDAFRITSGDDVINADVFTKLVERKTLEFEPGEKYSYSNSGYIMLALIIEKVAGQPFHLFMKEQIFDPLGMNGSLVYDRSTPEFPNRARGYDRIEGAYELLDYNIFTQGAGGFYSTVEDLVKWDQCLYTEKLVSFETLQEAYTPQVQIDENSSYGFGWRLSDYKNMKQYAHSGSLRGFKTYISRIPEGEFTIIILTNGRWRNPGNLTSAILGFYFPEEPGD
ncbi:serine hydrolase domain-containing protein [candidate division KSB1 bacterium]